MLLKIVEKDIDGQNVFRDVFIEQGDLFMLPGRYS